MDSTLLGRNELPSEGESETQKPRYESPERLMDESQVQESRGIWSCAQNSAEISLIAYTVCEILGIPAWAVNNYTPTAPPRGALVSRREGGIPHSPWVCPEPRWRSWDSSMGRRFNGRAGIRRGNLPMEKLATDTKYGKTLGSIRHLLRVWLLHLACDDFRISPDEIRKRAAWAWYRTGMLCALAARGCWRGRHRKSRGRRGFI